MSFHNVRDKNGRFTRKSGPVVTRPEIKPKPITQTVAKQAAEQPKLVNHIAILLDSSGSIGNRDLTHSIIDAYNKQVATIKEQAHKSGQTTFFSLYVFGELSYTGLQQIKNRCFESHIEQAPFLTSLTYRPSGNTPLVHCIERTIKDLSSVKNANDSNHSFLLIVLTDGEDTESSDYHRREVSSLVTNMINTDRWTFTCAGPAMAKAPMLALGFPAGNFYSWEGTKEEAVMMAGATSMGAQSFYATRAAGGTQLKSFYQTNLTGIDPKAVKNLQNWNNKFRRFAVTEADCPGVNQTGKPAVEISEFIKKQGLNYSITRGFYELTKTEEIQDHKEIAIVNLKDGTIYGGREAKDLLKLPHGGTIKVKPGDHAHYKVFVQSTSMNRKLIAGTEVLYREN